MIKNNILRMALPALMALAAVSCVVNTVPVPATEDGLLILTAATRTGADPMALDGENAFGSLAVFVFNADTEYLEFAEIVESFDERKTEWTASVRVSKSDKVVYAIGNWSDPKHVFTNAITRSLTMGQLDAMEVAGMNSDNLIMVGREEIEIDDAAEVNDTFTLAGDVAMERLAARIDLHLYKHDDLSSCVVVVDGVDLSNAVGNSVMEYNSTEMPLTVSQSAAIGATISTTLGVLPGDFNWSNVDPADATKTHFTYQYISDETVADALTPSLRVSTEIDGNPVEYLAYLETNVSGKYSLLRNTVYRVKGVLNAEGLLYLVPEIAEWDVVGSSRDFRDVTEGDFSLALSDLNAKTSSGDPLSVSFNLTAPAGASWVATITDGFNFEMTGTSRGAAGGVEATFMVSPKGVVGTTAYLYITVDGVEIGINPTDADNTHANGLKYPGTAKRIQLTHVQ